MCSGVENQGQLGSCTGNALVGALEFLERKDGIPYIELSRLFVYYNERVVEDTVRLDAGARIRDGIKVLASQGVCSEANWGYDVSKFATKPPALCYKEALGHKVTSYQRIQTVDEMRLVLRKGIRSCSVSQYTGDLSLRMSLRRGSYRCRSAVSDH